MERSKNLRVFGFLALLVSLVAVSLTYAGFTQTLSIGGTATVLASKWDVHFNNLKQSASGTTVVNTPAQIKTGSTSIGDYAVTLYSPGDSLTYTFDVVNGGNYNAKLTGLTIGIPTCKVTVTGVTNTNTVNVCNNISYELFDVSTGSKLTTPDNGVLSANGGTRSLRLVLTYKATNNEDYIANADIDISGLDVTLIYSQTGNYVAPSGS